MELRWVSRPVSVSPRTADRLGTFSVYTDTVVYAMHRNVSRLELDLYRLDSQSFMRLNSDWQAWDVFSPEEAALVRRWSQEVEAQRNEVQLARVDLVDDQEEPLPPGLYYLQLTAPQVEKPPDYKPERFMFVKARVNLTLKQH
jgi:hypothetical protein